MAKQVRVKRPPGELGDLLREQLQLLRGACDQYDSGKEFYAKQIALTLRVLLHHQGHSQALLEQMSLRNIRFYDTGGKLNPRNLLSESPLVGMRVGDGAGHYLPLVALGGVPIPPKQVPFAKWWNEPILKDTKSRFFNRRELVDRVANTDGGAHIDATLEQAFLDLSRRNALGWKVVEGEQLVDFRGRADLACIRQIGHEVLITLRRKVPQFFDWEGQAKVF